MYTNQINFYTPNLLGQYYQSEPSTYIKQGNTLDEVKDIDEIIKQAIELERFDDIEVLCETQIIKHNLNHDEYIDSDECIIKSNIIRTDGPSKYVQWTKTKLPNIFSIDWRKSRYEIIPN